jgi:hypothetical protein
MSVTSGSFRYWKTCSVIIKKYKPNDIVGFIVWSRFFVPVPATVFSKGRCHCSLKNRYGSVLKPVTSEGESSNTNLTTEKKSDAA